MPDITMCIHTECSKRYKCRRYMAYPSRFGQSYFMGEAYDILGGKNCDSYMNIKGWSDIMPKGDVIRLESKRLAWIKSVEAKGYVKKK